MGSKREFWVVSVTLVFFIGFLILFDKAEGTLGYDPSHDPRSEISPSDC